MTMKPRQILDMNAFDPKSVTVPADSLLARRQRNFGAASVLFYRHPLELCRASGSWVEAADGTRYLDFYNNVPSVGHGHPRVRAAVARQWSEININSRYLHPLTEQYLERLKETLPLENDNVVMTCSGSEANDLALRVAQRVSGGTGFVVTETAYHGNTAAVTAISPASFRQGTALPGHVQAIPAPGTGAYGDDVAGGFAAAVDQAIEQLRKAGHEPAALICDSVFSSDGVFTDPAGFLAPAVRKMRAQGGLYIADEVQPGFARTGEAFWGFARHGVTPDIVTMGKPMGNGYPMAGMATRSSFLDAMCENVGYFNTFGGTPVAAAAGLAVLEVIEDEGLQGNAFAVGNYLRQGLEDLRYTDERLAAPRGAGLFLGLDICDRIDGSPAPELAADLINELRARRVLIGAAGSFGHTLKLRPPLCVTRAEADFFLKALEQSLGMLHQSG
jgi:4-aminobutyrate aminotransferase-like enzyme